MPYCTHCGSGIGNTDRFCAHCGNPQVAAAGAFTSPPPPPPPPTGSIPPPPVRPVPPAKLRPNTAALLCYIPTVGWIPAVIFMTSESYRHDRYVRFHALQGLFLFVAYFLVEAVLGHVFWGFAPLFLGMKHWGMQSLAEMALVVCQIVGIVRCARGEEFHLPVIGELAERSMT